MHFLLRLCISSKDADFPAKRHSLTCSSTLDGLSLWTFFFFFFSPLTAAGCIAPIQPCLNCAAVTVEMKHKERHAEALFVNLLFKTNLFVFKLCWNLLKAVN